jgi:hypothetical protein
MGYRGNRIMEKKDIEKFVGAGACAVIGGLYGVLGAVRWLILAKEHGKEEAKLYLEKLFKRRTS